MKKYTIFLVILILLILGYFVSVQKNKEATNVEPISLCYFYSKKTDIGLYDKAWLRLNLRGEKVLGEFNNYPAETDSKIGKFEGAIGPLDQKTMARTVNLWWDSFAEGIKVKEELLVEFRDRSATVAYGEMIARGDGVYVYKDKNKLTFGPSFEQVSCADLDEKIVNVGELP